MTALRRFLLVTATCWLAIVLIDVAIVYALPKISLKIYFYLLANKDFHNRISAYLLLRAFLLAVVLTASITPVMHAFYTARDYVRRADPRKAAMAHGAGAAIATAAASFLLVRAVGLLPMLIHY